eukprot:gnl/TRDRNA2_/TRDRNA2_158584_c0_seq2.p1 gnl/TRDRNA2_/TRDRNA2_158584_c0~~gnl/TRDRNA2_/TRDRNA2_158584_c0_seq2.p1  ORF type:complete len:272 (+),score=59.03 gnl/TRDRNA2_/TRDRNA2_158584_c0_seq2:36-851(+)
MVKHKTLLKRAKTTVLRGKVGAQGAEAEIVAEVFRQFDLRGDGVIRRRELAEVLQTLGGQAWTPELIDRVMEAVDKNGDGMLQYEEFVDWIFQIPSKDSAETAFREVLAGLPDKIHSEAAELERQAEEALDYLNEAALGEMTSLSSPPELVTTVCEAVMHLLAGFDPAIPVDTQGRLTDTSWSAMMRMLCSDNFIYHLVMLTTEIAAGRMPKQNIKAARAVQYSKGYLFTLQDSKDHFSTMRDHSSSAAAAWLCKWVICIISLYDYIPVSP